MFILADSYGDGGALADISVNGDYVGSVATAWGDAQSPYSGLYEAPFSFDVQDDDGGGGDTYSAHFSLDLGDNSCDFVSVTGTWDGWSGWGLNYGDGLTEVAGLEDGSTHEFLVLCASGDGWWYDIWEAQRYFNQNWVLNVTLYLMNMPITDSL